MFNSKSRSEEMASHASTLVGAGTTDQHRDDRRAQGGRAAGQDPRVHGSREKRLKLGGRF